MSDESDRARSAGTGINPGADDPGDGRTAVVTRPARPSGKRSRRGAVGEDASEAVDLATGTKAAPTKNGAGAKAKTTRKRADRPDRGARNPIAYIYNYLRQVITELRKVIWPNRQQMMTYTTVVMLFLAFMVALIGFADLGLTKLVMIVLGGG